MIPSEENKEILFELAQDMLCVAGFDGYFKQLNPFWEKVLGFSREELMSKPYIEWVHPDDHFLTHKEASKLAEEGTDTILFENRFLAKDGSYKWLSWNSRAVKEKKLVYAVARDITRQKQTEEALKEADSKLKAFVLNTPAAIAMFDSDMLFIMASEMYLKEFNLNSKEIIGKSWYDIFPKENEIRRLIHQKCLTGQVYKDDEAVYETRGVKEFYTLEIRPWYKIDHSIGGLMIFKENVTFKKIAQEEVVNKSQMLNGLLKNLPVVIFRIDEKGSFTESIGAGLKSMGLRSNQVVGMNAYEVFPDLKKAMDKLNRGESTSFINQGVHNGKEWYYENYIFPNTVLNKGFIGFSIDITEKKQGEKELKKAKIAAEKANQFKSRFLARMSHEIRTPLNAIIGFAGILQKQKLQPEHQEYLQYITSSGTLVLKLIGDILDLSKIEEGKLIVENRSFHFKEAITSGLMPYKFLANKRDLSFHLNFEDRLPSYLYGDSFKIQQVLINLIGNALKFTKQGGLTIDFSLVNNNPNVDDEVNIRISVSDTGVGIPKGDQVKIFEDFDQGDSIGAGDSGGYGLGLGIVKQIVKLMGGNIEVISPSNIPAITGGPGSTFCFSLKLKIDSSPDLDSLKPISEEKIYFENVPKILVAEDNIINQKLIKIMLENLGCEISFANNGKEALDKINESKYDLIFMDVQMPLMSGHQATIIIRNELKIDTPIIGFSANVNKEDIENCLESGMNDYLIKPIGEVKLQQMVSKWVKENLNKKFTNLDYLRKIANNDKKTIKEMILSFLYQKDEFLKNIEIAINNLDWDNIAYLAHKLRSCVYLIGLNNLYEILNEIEKKSKEEQIIENLLGLIDEVRKICGHSENELYLELSSLSLN